MSGPTDPPADRPEDGALGDAGATPPPPPPPPPPAGDYPPQQQYGGQQYAEQQYAGQQYAGQQQYGAPPARQGNGLAVTGLVLGILGALFAFIPFLGVVLGVVFGVLAAIFGGVGLSRAKDPSRGGKGMAIAGIVLGIIAVVVSLLQGALLGAAGNAIINENPNVLEDLEEFEQQLEDLGTS